MMRSLLAGLLITFGFLSCGEESSGPDKDPPEVKAQSPLTLRRFDSLTITFSEKIDTSLLEIQTDSGHFRHFFKGEDKLLLFGQERIFGQQYFSPFEPVSVRLQNLQDKEGNQYPKDVVIDLDFYTWADEDLRQLAYNGVDSLISQPDSKKWKAGGPLNTPLLSEGIIQGAVTLSQGDFMDLKLLYLEPEDVLNIELACPAGVNFILNVQGPFPSASWSDSLAKLNQMSVSDERNRLVYSECASSGYKIKKSFTVQYPVHKKFILSDQPGAYLISIMNDRNEDKGFYLLKTDLVKFTTN